LVAVLDIGKTNSKLLVVDAATGATHAQYERASKSVAVSPGLLPESPLGMQLDVAGIEQWLRECLADLPSKAELAAIVPIAHGAAAVLLDSKGDVLAAPDYENQEFDEFAADYRALRDAFTQTYSPFLPRGLNLGRQLHWLQRRQPALFGRCAYIVTYAQYWAWRFSGVLSCEITSLGCHTDLWRPLVGQYSHLAVKQGWAARCAPVRRANDMLGTLTAEWIQHCGLNRGCRVICGIHDSNASYLAHAMTQPRAYPFTAVSSGTWTVIMARGVDLRRLDEAQDMLANIDAFGVPVGTARFAGGREYQVIAGLQVAEDAADADALRAVLEVNAMALPSFSDSGGSFAGRTGLLINAERLLPTQCAALAALYLALMTDLLLERLNARGEVLIDGPLAQNALYGGILSAFRSHQVIRNTAPRVGPVQAGLFLAGYNLTRPARLAALKPSGLAKALLEHRARWRQAL
jgi:sugar (pentulose or hexulose) kinase